MRLYFRWLVEGRPIDHSTIGEFRIGHAEELKKLDVQFAMIGIEFGWVRMTSPGFDGTRISSEQFASGQPHSGTSAAVEAGARSGVRAT